MILNAIQTLFDGISISITSVTIVLAVILYIQLILYVLKITYSKKMTFISIVAFLGCLICSVMMYSMFGIFPFVNIGLYENIFIQTLQVVVSSMTVILVIWLIFLFIFYFLGLKKHKTKPSILITVGGLILIIFSVIWIYQMTGLLLFTDLAPYVYL